MKMEEDKDIEEVLIMVSHMYPEHWIAGYAQRLRDNRCISPGWDEAPAGLDLDVPEQLAWWNGYYTAKLATQPSK